MSPKSSATRVNDKIRIGLLCAAVGLLVVAGISVLFRGNQGTRENSINPDRGATASIPPGHLARPHASAAPADEAILERLVLVSDTNLTTAQLVAQLLDESLPLKTRRQAARALARRGSDEALTALKQALASGPPYLKAAIAEGLGQSPYPEARGLLLELANGADEIAARGAARGLALRGDAESVQGLADILFNARRPASVRAEAALSLGDVPLPGAQESLVRALAEIQDETITESVLEALGQRPFAETQEIFQNYLDSKSVSAESKISALEALRDAEGDVAPFLLKYLADANPDIRAAAAWALSTAGNNFEGDSVEIGPQVLAILKQEPDARVRARLYEVMAGQNNADAPELLGLIRTESDLSARLAGFTCLAGMLRSPSASDVPAFFNQTAVPELKNLALQAGDRENRFLSVIALSRAKTAESLNALHEIAGTSRDPKIVEAARAAVLGPPRR